MDHDVISIESFICYEYFAYFLVSGSILSSFLTTCASSDAILVPGRMLQISEYFFLFWTICTGSWIVPPKYFPSVESLKPSHNVIPPQYGPLIGWYSWHHPPRLHKCLTIYPNRGYSTYGYIVIRSIYKTIWPEHSHFPICLRTMNLGTPHDLTCPLHGILPKKVPIYDTSMSTPSVSMTKLNPVAHIYFRV